jgi:hypothetical protein
VSKVVGLSILFTERDFISLEERELNWTLAIASETGAEIFMVGDFYGTPYPTKSVLLQEKTGCCFSIRLDLEYLLGPGTFELFRTSRKV